MKMDLLSPINSWETTHSRVNVWRGCLKEPLFFAPFDTKKGSFYQYRLGINIGKQTNHSKKARTVSNPAPTPDCMRKFGTRAIEASSHVAGETLRLQNY
eukprot:COSAG06_NODE_612_length_13800_cov_14.100650_1_plen_99_part_00